MPSTISGRSSSSQSKSKLLSFPFEWPGRVKAVPSMCGRRASGIAISTVTWSRSCVEEGAFCCPKLSNDMCSDTGRRGGRGWVGVNEPE